MKFHQHAVISLGISGLLYLIFKSWALAGASLIAGVFVDLDYGADYLLQRGFPLRIKDIFQAYREDSLLKVRFLHGWEWLPVWGMAAWLTDWNPWITGTLIGFAQHLVLDKVNHGENFLCYSFLWRWKKGFKSEDIFMKSGRR
ncbi:MAG: hypothetical protein C4581_02770 [Nitrospiraceae bacterium]|nr:MAG: hypothetical protein C4581_02770 [Nitrospiraceae bacterium]